MEGVPELRGCEHPLAALFRLQKSPGIVEIIVGL
jgi:hypothetical protein